jgi:hypothetical protein
MSAKSLEPSRTQGDDALRAAVREAWEAVPEDFFEELLKTMEARMKAVIEANGMHTKF